MPTYAFIPGTHPALSLAELRALNVGKPSIITPAYFVFASESELDATALQHRLGGTIKIVHILETTHADRIETVFDINHLLSVYFAQSEEKILFGVSAYGEAPRTLVSQLRRAGFEAKKHLGAAEYSARFLFDPSGIVKTAAVEKNHLIDRGAEIVVLVDGEKLHVGKTLTLQDFESYSERDYGRPVRDTKSGTLPPKLAQMMINLAAQPTTSTLLDPFCGSGTVLQEAIRMGYTDVIGSDLSDKAVNDTQVNLSWFKKTYGVKTSITVFQKDVREISKELREESVDAVVAETYLGPPQTRLPDAKRLAVIIDELTSLYREALRSLDHVVKKDGVIILAIPYFRLKHEPVFIPIQRIAASAGWKTRTPLAKNELAMFQAFPDRGLLYARSAQLVGREIVILRKERPR